MLCSTFLLLYNVSCAPTPSKAPVSVNSQIDSIVGKMTNVDSLISLTDYYSQKKDAYGEMVVRKALGEYYYLQSNYIDAINEHRQSLVLAESLEDTARMVGALNQLGRCLRNLGVTGQSAEYHFRALGLYEQWSLKKTEMAKRHRVSSLNGIGSAQLTLGNYVRAEAALRLALDGEEELKNLAGQAEIYANLGTIKEEEGQMDSAFYYYERSLEMNRNAKSKLGIALCYNHFGRLAEANGDLDAALRYYYRAYYIMSEQPIRVSTLESSLSMARVYMMRGDMTNARKYIDESWALAQETRSLNMMAEACLLKSQFAEREGKAKLALDWYKRGNVYKDSVINERTQIFVQKVRQQYVSDRNSNELELLRSNYTRVKKDSRAFVAWAILAGIFALLCIVVLLYMLRMRMRSQAMMNRMEKVRTDFFTNITHEFRTPLTVMLGLGQKIADNLGGIDGAESKRIGEMIVRQGNSLLDLVNQLLDIAKAESAIGKAEWRTSDIAPYLSMIIENCQVYATQKHVTLAYAASDRELVMDFVPDYLRKVLQNLLTNAIKYSGEGGKVTVQMQRKGNGMQLLVTDTGKGIAAEDIPHIFDAFYTATNWGIEVSAGVGLAMVKQMVVAMKGTIEVDSILGKGTRFRITLPLKQGERKFSSMSDSEYQVGTEYIPTQNVDKPELPIDELSDTVKSTILVIEDNRDVATYIGMQLSKKYRVAYAANGKEGIERAEELMPDLIVTDLMMPLMDGYEVCRQVRKSEVLNHIPIIILSAKSTESDKLKGLESGADTYLYKPFNSEELLVTVSNLIEQRKALRLRFAVGAQSQESAAPTLKPYERDFLNKFVDLVYRQMPKGNIDAESLASSMCMSSSQLRRKIFAITGEKLTSYVLQIRLKHAKQLLDAQGDMPVADVASRCGFEDAAYFSRIFKNVYQMTPSQYRRQGNVLS